MLVAFLSPTTDQAASSIAFQILDSTCATISSITTLSDGSTGTITATSVAPNLSRGDISIDRVMVPASENPSWDVKVTYDGKQVEWNDLNEADCSLKSAPQAPYGVVLPGTAPYLTLGCSFFDDVGFPDGIGNPV